MEKNNKKTTTVRIPLTLEKKLLTSVIHSNYGMKGKSRWIEEAVLRLLELSNYPEHVNWDLTSENNISTKTMSLSFSLNTIDELDKAVVEVRQSFPKMEGVKSRIIRAAIMQRILNPFRSET